MAFVLALDQGTTSSRAVVFDGEGTPVAAAQREFPQHYPRPGWVEHDPHEIWSSQAAVVAEALADADMGPRDVAAIGITNQRETTVVWDRSTGQPVHRAIVWQDRRTASMIDRINAEGAGPMIRRKTGLVPDPYFSASKIAWILDNVPGARTDAEAGRLAFGTIDTWLVHRLTEGRLHLTDVSNASRTMLYDIHAGRWDDELLELFGVPRSMLPEVRASSEVYGEASAVGGVPIAGIAGDQQAALAGQACFTPGMAKATYGTGCFLLLNTGPDIVDSGSRLVSTVAWRIGDLLHHALEGSVFIGGAVVQWLRDGLGLIESAADVETLARTVGDNGGVYLVPAFTGLGAPHWDPYARGAILGLTRGSTAGHLARAALESIAYQCADLFDAMAADFPADRAELRVDGGASADNLLLQFQADLLGVPIVRPRVTETTVLGAAYLAGLATGVWKNLDEVARQWRADRRFEPQMDRDRAAALRSRWNEAVKRASAWEPSG